MNFAKDERLKFLGIIKFKDKISFSIDGESIRNQVMTHYNDWPSNAFRVMGRITELESGKIHEEQLFINFTGFFRQTVSGSLWLADKAMLRDFGRYDKSKPYLLSFYYDGLEPAPERW